MKPHGNQIHGYARRGQKTPTYKAWESMVRRCTMPSQSTYPSYGGRGIVICLRWRDFRNFLEDMGEKPEGMTLDRIDVNGNYEPDNCRWADAKTQHRNKRHHHWITYNGETKCLAQWADDLGIKARTLRARLVDYAMPVELAFTKPIGRWS